MAISTVHYEFWRQHVRQWQESGLTQNAYCELHNINRVGLSRWQRRLAEKPTLDSPITLVPTTRLPASGPLILRNGP